MIARRICVKELIKRHREEELGHTNAHRAFIDDGVSGEVEAIVSAEEVERMLEDLTEREAEVVRLYHLKFLNYRQIGKQLGLPENSIGPILAKARKKLREAAEQTAKCQLTDVSRGRSETGQRSIGYESPADHAALAACIAVGFGRDGQRSGSPAPRAGVVVGLVRSRGRRSGGGDHRGVIRDPRSAARASRRSAAAGGGSVCLDRGARVPRLRRGSAPPGSPGRNPE